MIEDLVFCEKSIFLWFSRPNHGVDVDVCYLGC